MGSVRDRLMCRVSLRAVMRAGTLAWSWGQGQRDSLDSEHFCVMSATCLLPANAEFVLSIFKTIMAKACAQIGKITSHGSDPDSLRESIQSYGEGHWLQVDIVMDRPFKVSSR